jgi:hypothetical protein
MTSLHDDLASARMALRAAQDSYKLATACAEQRAIAALNGSVGKNEDERKRNLLLALAQDVAHTQSLTGLRSAEFAVDRLEAAIERQRDARREQEWAIRLRMVEVLEARAVYPDEGEPMDSVLDDEIADAAWEDAHGSYNGRVPGCVPGTPDEEFPYADMPF